MGFNIDKFDYWVQKVLPMVYDDSLSYYELLNKVVMKLNEVIDESNKYFEQDLKSFVASVLLDWYKDGTLATIINDEVFAEMTENIRRYGSDPKYFGAVGDGVTDDTVPVRQAISYAENNKVKVFFSGVYAITGEIEVKQPLLLEGTGSGSGYGEQALTAYKQISGLRVKGTGQRDFERVVYIEVPQVIRTTHLYLLHSIYKLKTFF